MRAQQTLVRGEVESTSRGGNSPRCSVIVPAYNAERWIGRTIDSVLAQTMPDLELIVVDDGSTDGTVDALSRFGDDLVLIRQENAGVAAARNAGARRAVARHLAFLDADDLWEPQKLERQLDVIEANADLVLVHGPIIEIDADDHPLDGVVHHGMSGDVHQSLFLQESVIYGGGSGSLYARWAFDEVGGFDERFSSSADWHLWLRITKLGPVGMVEEPILAYRIHDSNMHNNVSAESRDMFLGIREAIAGDPVAATIGNKALAKCHQTVAGGYWNEGSYLSFVRHFVAAVVRRPSSLAWFVGRLGERLFGKNDARRK